MKVIHRYIFFEIVRLFVIFLAVFIFVVLMFQISEVAQKIMGYGVSSVSLLKILIKMVPSFLGILFPMSLTFAVIVALFLLGERNEIVAMKSCGISVKEIFKPILFFSLIITVLSFFSIMFVMPVANLSIKKDIYFLSQKKVTLNILPETFSTTFPGVTFYATKVFPDKSILENFMVSVSRKNEKITIFANFGKLRTENGTVFLDVKNGTAQILNWNFPENLKVLDFKTYILILHRFVEFKEDFKSKYLTLFELLKRWNTDDQIEFFKRLTLSLSPLIVAVFAFAIGISVQRGSVGKGILLGMVVVVVYYLFYVFAKKATKSIGFTAFPLVVDLIFILVSVYIYKRAIEEKSIFPGRQ